MDLEKRKIMLRGPRPRISAGQKEALKDFMQQHPDLAKGFSRTPEAKRRASFLWEELSTILNAHGDGISKTGKEWKRYYNDFKSKLKHKNSLVKRHKGGTGGGPPLNTSFTDTEEGLLEVLGDAFGEGAPGIQVNPFPQSTSEEVEEELLDTDSDDDYQRVISESQTMASSGSPSSHSPPQERTSQSYTSLHDQCQQYEDQPSTSRSFPSPHHRPSPSTSAPLTTSPLRPANRPLTAPNSTRAERTPRPRARAGLAGNSSRTTAGRCLTQLEESRRTLAQIEADRVAAERTHADALMGLQQAVVDLKDIVIRLAIASERRAATDERRAAALERMAKAAESRAEVERRRLENEERGVENIDPNECVYEISKR